MIGLIGIAPLLDVGSVLHALLGHIQYPLTAPVRDWAGVNDTPIGPDGISVIGVVITSVVTTVVDAISSSTTDFKIGSAAAIHPDPTIIDSPGLPLHTVRSASLSHQPNVAAIGVDGAVVASPIIRCTVDVLHTIIVSIVTSSIVGPIALPIVSDAGHGAIPIAIVDRCLVGEIPRPSIVVPRIVITSIAITSIAII